MQSCCSAAHILYPLLTHFNKDGIEARPRPRPVISEAKAKTTIFLSSRTVLEVEVWDSLRGPHRCVGMMYLADLCQPVASAGSRQRLRSATRGDLVISPTVTYFGARSFAVAGPKAWNQLPADISASDSVNSFKGL